MTPERGISGFQSECAGYGPLNRDVQAESFGQRRIGPDLSPDISFEGIRLAENPACRQGIFIRAQVKSIEAKALSLETEDALYFQRHRRAAGLLMAQPAMERPLALSVSFSILQPFEHHGTRDSPLGKPLFPFQKSVRNFNGAQLLEE